MNNTLTVKVDEALKAKFDNGDQNFKVGGVFGIQHIRNGEVIAEEAYPNLVVNEGLDYILDAALSGGSQTTTFYIGIYKNNYTPIASNVMATFAGSGVANEISAEIDESVRQTWTDAGVSSRSVTNSASPAVFTANATVAVYGAFLSTNNTLGGTTGKLVAATKFASVRNLLDTDTLNVTYTFTIADA